jgi:hypothetical protein
MGRQSSNREARGVAGERQTENLRVGDGSWDTKRNAPEIESLKGSNKRGLTEGRGGERGGKGEKTDG